MDPQRPPHAQVHPRPQPDLPGLIQQDTTWINPDAQKYDFAESDSAEREVSKLGIEVTSILLLKYQLLNFIDNINFPFFRLVTKVF